MELNLHNMSVSVSDGGSEISIPRGLCFNAKESSFKGQRRGVVSLILYGHDGSLDSDCNVEECAPDKEVSQSLGDAFLRDACCTSFNILVISRVGDLVGIKYFPAEPNKQQADEDVNKLNSQALEVTG
ncbi:hypothetical protein TorRG33x02_275190 [Trema orientale]|uniref:Uncharacterized protein n=1 Tax=Trema orientale TaxID=63057 RepID=A0A2P5CRX4_TREOI|nr:hypothetical protein TorRG33x02_275190 [Trema orientale]